MILRQFCLLCLFQTYCLSAFDFPRLYNAHEVLVVLRRLAYRATLELAKQKAFMVEVIQKE